MVSPDFLYLIPLANDNLSEASPYQGFTPSILESPRFIFNILQYPSNLLELYCSHSKVISLRMCGLARYNIVPIDQTCLARISVSYRMPFVCIFSDEDTITSTLDFIQSSNFPMLHISTTDSKGANTLDEVDSNTFTDYAKRVVECIRSSIPQSDFQILSDILEKQVFQKAPITPLTNRFHFLTLPNESVLSSVGYKLKDGKPLFGNDNEPYTQAIIDAVNAVNAERMSTLKSSEPFPFPPTIDLIITAPSIYKHLYGFSQDNQEYRNNEEYRLFIKTHKKLKQQTGYSIQSTKEEFEEMVSSPIGQHLIGLRKQESLAYTAAVSVKATNSFCPVIRLPPAVNTLRTDLHNIADCSRTGNQSNKAFKLNRLCRQFKNRLQSIVDPRIIDQIGNQNDHVKLIIDSPLEWLSIRDLPLCLRSDVSRISTTPGNVLLQQCLSGEQIMLPMQAFEEILIIRSFDENDPIGLHLKIAVDSLEELNNGKDNSNNKATRKANDRFRVKIRWVEVQTIDEFIEALNSFEGAIVVFDGHGISETDTTLGSLKIGNSKLDTWTLRGKVRIPPIVLLSACDTHSLDSSHASVANGFLVAGAMTVVATLLPIEARRAADFVARLILRIEQFLPIVVSRRRCPIRWTKVVSGLQRMSFISETLLMLTQKSYLKITPKTYFRIHSEANTHINQLKSNWYEQYIDTISKEAHVSPDVMKQAILEWASIPECIKYTQLGNPELILITPDPSDIGQEAE